MWQIRIDTGGTFTDCLAISPSGELKRTKVLSSSFLRGRILEQTAPKTYRIATNWSFDSALVTGYAFRMVGDRTFVKIADIHADILVLENDLPLSGTNTDADNLHDFEITTHEEAPVLATRIVTETLLSGSFPPLTMRLGTTKGTNALLERKGAKVTLYVTKGYRDLLRIGTQQRPHLFQLAIPEPVLLYDEVIEAEERLDAKGNVILPLAASEAALPRAENNAVAVSFLHSYLNPVHEQQLSNTLTERGCSFISSSAELYAGINYFKRTQTALVNAYLQPILSDYLANIKQSLGRQAVLVMTSAGGLINADSFRAKDSLLSGPAGGMVGAAAIAQQLGFQRCLTFDMGGTSTDTARFDGKLDLEFVTKIEGIELHNPTLAIETVAAGGGSVCSFDGQKLRVGPESAGANPGPASYGAGGPLTITDVNLLLGKLDTSRFGIPVRMEKAREALESIQKQIFDQTNQQLTDAELLRGFEQIANEKMAEAIRRISVAKGFDPKEYPLLTFGGAGGLHGCQLAEILHINTVILPYDAGLLSAYGMGRARVERILSQQILQPLTDTLPRLEPLIRQLSQKAVESLLQEGIKAAEVSEVLLYLRFKGQENAPEIPYQKGEMLEQRFRAQYQQLFGYCPTALPIEIESIKVIVGEKKASPPVPAGYHPEKEATPFKSISVYASADRSYPVFDWEQLAEGDFFKGPAVLLNATSTSFIPANWQAVVTPTRDVVVQLLSKTAQSSEQTNVNQAIELELFTNRFMAIAEEMGAQLQRTAFSVNVKERLDFSCALLDADAELLVNAPHIPVHLGSLGVCARLVREKIAIGPGDVIITNHPKYGGSHLPDVTLLSGVFTTNNGADLPQLIGYVINRAHHAEIGGRTPGSMPPDAVTLQEEGVVILPTYLVKNGEMQWKTIERLFTQSLYPTRALTENIADINAALASLRSGETALQTLVAQHGLPKVHRYMQLLKNSAFEALQEVLKTYHGIVSFKADESLDDGHKIVSTVLFTKEYSFENEEEKEMFELSGGESWPNYSYQLTFDFTGSSACHPHNLNANISIIYSAVLYVLRLLVNKNIPLNEGLMQGVKVILPDNSFLHPHFSDDPAQCPAVVGGNTEVSQRLVDTLLKAFQSAACSQGTMNNFLFGNGQFGYYETICGGTGATAEANGRSAVHQHMTNTRITDAEELERRYPIRLNRFAIREGSGGTGHRSGGDGVIREVTFLEPLRVTLITQHRVVPPYGMQGGQNGQPGSQTLFRKNGNAETLSGICSVEVEAGDSLRIETPGGGGFGKLI